MNKLVKLIMVLLVGALLAVTSAMSYDFIRRTLPPGQELLAFAALAAFGVGAIGWTFFFKQATGWPKWVALLLILLDVIGEGTLFMADIYLNAASRFGLQELTPDQASMFIMAFGGVVVLNILGGIFIEILDPDSLRRSHELEEEHSRAESDLEIRKIEHRAEIDNRTALANQIRERSRQYNQERMPQLLDAWQGGADIRYNQVEQALRLGFKPGGHKRDELPAPSRKRAEWDEEEYTTPTQPVRPLTAAPVPVAQDAKKIGFAHEVFGIQHALHYQSASGQERTVAVAENIQGLKAIAGAERGGYQTAWITDQMGETVWTAPVMRGEPGGPLPPAK